MEKLCGVFEREGLRESSGSCCPRLASPKFGRERVLSMIAVDVVRQHCAPCHGVENLSMWSPRKSDWRSMVKELEESDVGYLDQKDIMPNEVLSENFSSVSFQNR